MGSVMAFRVKKTVGMVGVFNMLGILNSFGDT
jgi:hypothetical protein